MRSDCPATSVAVLLAALVPASVVNGADDDVVIESVPPIAGKATQRSPADLRAEEAKLATEIEQEFLRHLDSVAEKCSLTPEQKEKARIAGKRDVRRFAHAMVSSPVARRLNGLSGLREVPIGIKITTFFNDVSFVTKVLKKHMTSEQWRSYDAIL
jgi:hypothetical protein